jgi:hypothetical protein
MHRPRDEKEANMAVSETEKKLHDLIQLRLQDAKATMVQLQPLASRWSRGASLIRGLLILLGALVATASFAEQAGAAFLEGEEAMMILQIAYTIGGVLVTFLAGLETAFKIPEKAVGLRTLHADAAAGVRRYMAAPFLIEESDEVARAAGLRSVVAAQNEELATLQRKAADLDVELRLDTVDYTDPLAETMLGDNSQ